MLNTELYDEDVQEIINCAKLTNDQIFEIITSINNNFNITSDASSIEKQLISINSKFNFILKLIIIINNEVIGEDEYLKVLYDEINDSYPDESIEFDSFVVNLKQLINIDSLIISVKSAMLADEFQNKYSKSRIFTDIRPVFHKNTDDKIMFYITVHNLKFIYYNNNVKKEFFISLDDNNINELKNVLIRAEKKSLILKKTIEGE